MTYDTSRHMPGEPVKLRQYVVVSPKCVYGEVGELIKLELTDLQEKSLLESGAVELPPVATETATVAENEEGEADGQAGS
jgi:hypothetical protein